MLLLNFGSQVLLCNAPSIGVCLLNRHAMGVEVTTLSDVLPCTLARLKDLVRIDDAVSSNTVRVGHGVRYYLPF